MITWQLRNARPAQLTTTSATNPMDKYSYGFSAGKLLVAFSQREPVINGLTYFAIQIQSPIFKTQSKSNHSPKNLKNLKHKSK